MSDETPDTTGLRECRYPCACEQFPEEHCSCMDGHDPTPDASPDPAVVTPDAGARLSDMERTMLLVSAGKFEGDPSIPGLLLAVERIVANHVAAAREVGRVWAPDGVDGHPCIRVEAYEAALVRAKAAEADRAEVERLRTSRDEWAEMCRDAQHWRDMNATRAEAAEERLAELLVAQIEALADDGRRTTYSPYTVYVDDLRALIPADTATALAAVREKVKAEERERIAQAIEAERERSEWILKAGMQRAATIARHTPEAT